MFRTLPMLLVAAALLPAGSLVAETSGHYMEARTCQIYTGPCFANGESGITGKDAVLAWRITEDTDNAVSLKGLSVIMVVRASHTLGFQGMENAEELKSLIVVDEKADVSQRAALVAFAKKHAGRAGDNVVDVRYSPVSLELETTELTGKLSAGKYVELSTRKARKGDCICSNESAYYPPLVKLENFAPGVTLEGKVNGRGLGVRWEIPDTRSAYMGEFYYE
ncbi:DUF1326 domain-containing protein [Lignipirellula cremea]|uniref:DUF1326 domain-containing protein n=1 Tax=Lignipirellula cremea TaxID=2528010 RepID=A0A518DN36_9BACT|nr:DUF1326 domain-containing protein [Lignipirellula cremea]QDU93242.1 hypothetical protein Pla8534_10210 [Lignipirellula cremea]